MLKLKGSAAELEGAADADRVEVVVALFRTIDKQVGTIFELNQRAVIVVGSDRVDCLRRTRQALDAFRVEGVDTTLGFLRMLLDRPEFMAGTVNTRWAEAVMAELGVDATCAS